MSPPESLVERAARHREAGMPVSAVEYDQVRPIMQDILKKVGRLSKKYGEKSAADDGSGPIYIAEVPIEKADEKAPLIAHLQFKDYDMIKIATISMRHLGSCLVVYPSGIGMVEGPGRLSRIANTQDAQEYSELLAEIERNTPALSQAARIA